MERAHREAHELAERWRLASLLLQRLNPDAFEALVVAAEIIVAETPEPCAFMNITD